MDVVRSKYGTLMDALGSVCNMDMHYTPLAKRLPFELSTTPGELLPQTFGVPNAVDMLNAAHGTVNLTP